MKKQTFSLKANTCRRVCQFLLLLSTLCYLPTGLAEAQENTQPLVEGSMSLAARDDVNDKNTTSTVLAESTPEGIASETVNSTDNNTPDIHSEVIPIKATAKLPHNLSPWGMFMAADWVVKTVMTGLAIASLLTWTVLVSKTIELNALKRQLRHNCTNISRANTLADAANTKDIKGVGREFIMAAESELRLSLDLVNKVRGKEGIKERVVSSFSRIEASSSRQMLVATGLLATIGAIGPFVGLMGTVWGIMNSFIGISQANTTNLAVVAPGIAEALLATAMGLVAAIPAVVFYNHFTRQIAGARALVSDSAAAVMRLVSRDLDRGVSLRVVKSRVELEV